MYEISNSIVILYITISRPKLRHPSTYGPVRGRNSSSEHLHLSREAETAIHTSTAHAHAASGGLTSVARRGWANTVIDRPPRPGKLRFAHGLFKVHWCTRFFLLLFLGLCLWNFEGILASQKQYFRSENNVGPRRKVYHGSGPYGFELTSGNCLTFQNT